MSSLFLAVTATAIGVIWLYHKLSGLLPTDDIIVQHYYHFESKKERKCREILEKIYNKPFIRVRPNFLKNPKTGHNLEIDCYNDELKIGLEYCGIQHYKYPNFIHKSRKEFEDLVERDRIKDILCKHYGVYLIRVPYNIPDDQLESYIRSKLP
jgi:hypothetical protein